MLGESRVQGSVGKHKKLKQREVRSVTGEDSNIKEVVNYDSVSHTLLAEVFHRLNVQCVLDLSCKEDIVAGVALQTGILYCGITCTNLHAKLLQKQVTQELFNAMFEQTSRFHKPHLTDVFATVASNMQSSRAAISEDSPQSRTSASSSSPGLWSLRAGTPTKTPIATKKKRRLSHCASRLGLMVWRRCLATHFFLHVRMLLSLLRSLKVSCSPQQTTVTSSNDFACRLVFDAP